MTKTIKEKLKDKDSLQFELNKVLKSDLPNFLETTHTKKEEVTSNLKFGMFAGVFLIATFFFLYFSGATPDSLIGKIILAFALMWSTVLLLSGRSWLVNSRLLAREMNMALVPIMTNTLDKMVMYTYDDAKNQEVHEALDKSGLMKSKVAKVISNDRYYLYEDNESIFHEIRAVSEDGKKSFNGVFAVIPLSGVADTEVVIEENLEYRVLEEVLYVLLGDSSVSINVSIASTKPAAVNRYAMNALVPIWRSMLLADELRG